MRLQTSAQEALSLVFGRATAEERKWPFPFSHRHSSHDESFGGTVSGRRPVLAVVGGLGFPSAVYETWHAKRVVLTERLGEQVLREALVGHGTQEAADSCSAD